MEFMIHLELNFLIDYDNFSVIYVNISSDITLQTLWTHYVYVLWESKVWSIIFYAEIDTEYLSS